MLKALLPLDTDQPRARSAAARSPRLPLTVTRMTEVPPIAIELVEALSTPDAPLTEASAASTAAASGEENWTVKAEILTAAEGVALGVAPGSGAMLMTGAEA